MKYKLALVAVGCVGLAIIIVGGQLRPSQSFAAVIAGLAFACYGTLFWIGALLVELLEAVRSLSSTSHVDEKDTPET
ncbi:hypothetical protein [Amycolatopsis sp. lyj-23]|uniref:hypothetical protein n=1 Tax=Amycolatopsis sp. lyj-23 TaxID=2789283 RepID=UPI00397E3A52